MDKLGRFMDDIRAALGFVPKVQMSQFQRTKLLHEFHMFYDMNGDGKLQWKDFEMARDYICEKSGWKPSSKQWQHCRQLFIEIWRNLSDMADENTDTEVTQDEWLMLWKKISQDKFNFDRGYNNNSSSRNETQPPPPPPPSSPPHLPAGENKSPVTCAAINREKSRRTITADDSGRRRLPEAKDNDISVRSNDDEKVGANRSFIPPWLEKYIDYKFNLLDRAGDGVLDEEEFEFTLSDGFNVSPTDCRTAFRLMTQNGERTIDRNYFRTLALQFYFSNDPCDLGNFINGKLIYD